MNRYPTHLFVLTALVSLTFVMPPGVHAAVKATPATSHTALGSINDSMEGTTVEIEATVKSITPPREGSKAPVRINLSDATGSMTLIIWPDVFDVVKSQSPIVAGNTIHATAHVSKYRENLQLQIRGANDIQVIAKPVEAVSSETTPAPASPPSAETPAESITPVSGITTALMSRDVTVKAAISEVRQPRSEKAPYIVTLSQDGARISLVFWSDIEQQIKSGLKVGNVVQVKAQVGEHRGDLQIKLRNAADFSVISAAEQTAPPATTE